MNTQTHPFQSQVAASEARAAFMSRVYTWMTGGILLTASIATVMGQNPELMVSLVSNRFLFFGLMIAQLGLVIGLSAAINRISASTATLLYIAYAALTGVTMSTIFLIYAHDTIGGVFLSTACGFAGLSMVGYTTKRDLGPVGAFCGMALFGLIGWALLSWFFPSLMGGELQMVYSIVGLLIFAGLTAYDTQKIKQLAGTMGQADDEAVRKGAIFGALTLYLDFINLFLMLLRLAGGDRRR
jgi:FtsH-binding integral membrane protein